MNLDADSKAITNDDKALVSILNALIHICHDAQNGYMQAAKSITSSAYKTMFAEYAHQRSRFADQLSNLVIERGGDPDDDGHAMSMFSRGWENIQEVLTGGDYGDIFSECERSEDVSKSAYEKVLEQSLPDNVCAIIKQQYEQVVEAHDRIRSLRDAYDQEHKN